MRSKEQKRKELKLGKKMLNRMKKLFTAIAFILISSKAFAYCGTSQLKPYTYCSGEWTKLCIKNNYSSEWIWICNERN